MKGFKINTDSSGNLAMAYDQEDTIMNDILMSVSVRRGAFFQDPNFGLRELPRKRTAQNIALIKDYFKEALQWLLDTGKAKNLEILVEPDTTDLCRVNIAISVTQVNGQIVTYDTFVEVV